MINKYYIYEWIRLDTNEPFYIGKGSGKRWCTLTRGKNYHFNNIVKNIPTAVVILESNLEEKTAFEYEVYYINEYKNLGYPLVNIGDGGEGNGINVKGKNNPNYGKHLSEEHKKIISNINKGNTYWIGKKHSEETKKKFSEKRKGTQVGELNHHYGKNHSKETKEILSEKRKIKVICLDNNIIFNSLLEAGEWCGVTSSAIMRCCQGKNKTSGGYNWMYYEEYLKQCA